MDKQQIENAQKGYFRQIENIYQGMIRRARSNPEALKWAAAWRLEKLRAVCQKTRERLSKCQ